MGYSYVLELTLLIVSHSGTSKRSMNLILIDSRRGFFFFFNLNQHVIIDSVHVFAVSLGEGLVEPENGLISIVEGKV